MLVCADTRNRLSLGRFGVRHGDPFKVSADPATGVIVLTPLKAVQITSQHDTLPS